jgi:predicted transcriptional regulator YheO
MASQAHNMQDSSHMRRGTAKWKLDLEVTQLMRSMREHGYFSTQDEIRDMATYLGVRPDTIHKILRGNSYAA